MKNIQLLLWLVLCSQSVSGQILIKGVLVTADSKQPVPYANVYFTNNQSSVYVGTITDIAGRFEIKTSHGALPDSLTISCIGFEKLKIIFPSPMPDSLFMRESTTQLATVVVSDLSAKDYVVKCINRIPQNYQHVLFLNRGFNWQSLQVDSVFKKLRSSFVTIEYENLARSTKRKVRYDSTIAFSTRDFNPIIPTYDSLGEHIYFDMIRTGPGVLNPEQLAEWNFAFVYDEEENQSNAMIIEATSRGKLVNNFRLYINTDDWAFRKIEYVYRWPTGEKPVFLTREAMIKSSNDTVRYTLHTIQGVILYEKTKNKYNLKYLFNEVQYTQHRKELGINSPVKSFHACLRNELVISYSKEYLPGDLRFQKDRKKIRTDFEKATIHEGYYQAMKVFHPELP